MSATPNVHPFPRMPELETSDPSWVAQLRSKPLHTIPEVARILGWNRTTLYRSVQAGDLPTVQINGRHQIPALKLLAMLGAEGAVNE